MNAVETTSKPPSSQASPAPAPAPSQRRRLPLRLLRDGLLVAGFIVILIAGAKLQESFAPPVEEEMSNEQLRQLYEQARHALREGDSETAVEKSRVLVHEYTRSGLFWLLYGQSLHQDERYEQALTALETADTFPRFRGVAHFEMARSYLALGDDDRAIECLFEADDHSYRPESSVRQDDSFAALREDERFQRIARALDRRGRFVIE